MTSNKDKELLNPKFNQSNDMDEFVSNIAELASTLEEYYLKLINITSTYVKNISNLGKEIK
jgi:hypothetical protein